MCNAIDTISLFVEAIIGHFVIYIIEYKKATGKAQGQATDIDEGKSTMLGEIAESNEEIISYHGNGIYLKVNIYPEYSMPPQLL